MLCPAHLDDDLIGQPLPWDLYTGAGVLMVTAGMLIEDAAHLARLRGQELFRQASGTALQGSLTVQLEALAAQLDATLSPPHEARLGAAVETAAQALLGLHRHDPEACLGLSRLISFHSLAVRHCLLTALVCAAICEGMAAGEDETLRIMAAALSMNVAEMSLHDALARGTRSLGGGERQALNTHPQRSVEILVQGGVTDRLWLAAVLAHHENVDGSGYPGQLHGTGIPMHARLLRVADYYCAKISDRYYRPPRSPEHALKEIFGHERSRLDGHFAMQLLRRMGSYLPGTLVRLANREIAVVARRYGRKLEVRKVVSFLDYRGRPLERPTERDPGQRSFAIAASVERAQDWPTIEWERLWGY